VLAQTDHVYMNLRRSTTPCPRCHGGTIVVSMTVAGELFERSHCFCGLVDWTRDGRPSSLSEVLAAIDLLGHGPDPLVAAGRSPTPVPGAERRKTTQAFRLPKRDRRLERSLGSRSLA
jgi:hypothetical protein